VVWNSSHPDALTYINLGLGNTVTAFNITLHGVYNETGAGVTCLPNIGAAALKGANVTEGQNASIQVITISSTGAALYNCADITLTKNAPAVDSNLCKNSTGIGGFYLQNGNTNTSSTNSSSGGGNSNNSNSNSTKSGNAPRGVVSIGALMAAVGLGMAAVA